MTKEQQIAHWVPVVDIVLTARGTGESMEQRAIERYIRAVATEIVEQGGMAFDDDSESDGLIDPYDGD